MLTQERLKEVLDYNPETGVFTWKVNRGSRGKAGQEAGNINKLSGYRLISVDKKINPAHRLAFLYMLGCFPDNSVDHINGVRLDNRWCNLRDVPVHENTRNRRPHSNNKSGITGVRFITRSNKWLAEIKFDYALRHIGLFEDKFEAICARKAAEVALEFHENHAA